MSAIPFEIRDQAEEMYIADGLTLEQVGQELGVSVQALKQWSVKYEWKEKRIEYQESIGQIKRDTQLLRRRLVAKALESLDPRDVYSFARIEAITVRGQGSGVGDQPALSEEVEARKITTPKEAVDALQEVIEAKINLMLSQPGAISLNNVKDLKKALELVDELKDRYKTEKDMDGQAPVDILKKIRQEVYGII